MWMLFSAPWVRSLFARDMQVNRWYSRTPSEAQQEWLLVAVIAATVGGVVLGYLVAWLR